MIERTGQIKQKESDKNFKCRWDGHEGQGRNSQVHVCSGRKTIEGERGDKMKVVTLPA